MESFDDFIIQVQIGRRLLTWNSSCWQDLIPSCKFFRYNGVRKLLIQVSRSFREILNHGFSPFDFVIVSDTSSRKFQLRPWCLRPHIYAHRRFDGLLLHPLILANMASVFLAHSRIKLLRRQFFERPAAGDSTPSTSIPVVDIFQPIPRGHIMSTNSFNHLYDTNAGLGS